MFEELNQHRAAVEEQIQKGFEIGFTGGELEKAHNVGDIHPNGKWVWTRLPSGKYDWRVIKKTGAGFGGSAPATAQKKKEDHITISPNHPALGALKGVNAMKEYLTTFNSKYTDMSKVEVLRTPKGNWEVHYDGDRLGIFAGDQVPEGTAKKMGWLKTDAKDLIGYKRDVEEEAKKKERSVAQKKNETNAEAGIRIFNSLSKEKQAILLGKLKKESERFLKNGMKLNEIIGEVEEYRDNNIDFDEEMFDIARDLGVKHNEAYWVMKHAANLEIKRLEGLANDKKKANKTADDSPKETRIIFLNGKPYYIWNEGKDFRGSSQNPKDRIANANNLHKFDSSQGFESIDDVEEYVQTHFGKKFDAKDPYQVHAVNYLLGQPRWTMKSAERWVANLPEKKVKELADKDM